MKKQDITKLIVTCDYCEAKTSFELDEHAYEYRYDVICSNYGRLIVVKIAWDGKGNII